MMDQAIDRARVTQFVTLGLDREIFAVPVDSVREILEMRRVSKVPNAPPFMTGMIDVRGQAVPIVDLRVKLGMEPVPPDEMTRILVLDIPLTGGIRSLGLVADRVFEVADLDERMMETPPEVGTRWNSDYIQAVGRRNGAFVIIFDLAFLFSSGEIALIEHGGDR
jgi:purine-binding chemotaxis protein CheW